MLTQRDLCKIQEIPANARPTPMSLDEIKKLKEEFPGIKLYIGESITKIYNSKVEPALLDYSLATGKLEGYYGPDWIQEGIYFLDKKGEEVTAEINVQRRKFLFFGPFIWKTKKVFGRVLGFKHSSVRSMVNRFWARADSIRLLVSVYECTNSLIIYRLPKGVSIRKILREIEPEKTRLQSEVATTV